MPNPEQNVPLMIKRLEEANARARDQFARVDERISESEQDAARHPSDQQEPPAVPDRRSSRGGLALLGLIGSLLAACVGVVAFVWQSSYGDAAKLNVARWALPLAQTIPQDVAPTAAPMSPELAQRLQTMARDLANVEQGIEQLKTSQEQTVRDNAAVAEQLKAALSHMNRDNAAVAEQLKASQEQMDRLIATRTRRKPVATLPQAGAQPQAPVQSQPRQQ
jgi:hypothetical protein